MAKANPWKSAGTALLLLAWALPADGSQGTGLIRVACMGDSITAGQGSGVKGPSAAEFSYPALLDSILGDGFEVRGFGAGGHALRADANLVYGTSAAAAAAVDFAPNVAIIMLGTNDTRVPGEYMAWQADVDDLAARLRNANPELAIWLASPPQMFPALGGLSPERRADLERRRPKIDLIAKSLEEIATADEGIEFVDVRDVLRPRDVTDGVHPNPMGAERLAYRFADTLLRETVPRTTTPVPAVEYRGQAAGWGGGTWRDALATLRELEKEARDQLPVDVLFLGDSITQGLTGHGERWSREGGSRVFDLFQGGRRAVSLGLSGDRTEHLLYRIQEGSLDGFRPRTIVLQIGINNLHAAGHSAADTAGGISAVVAALETRFPESVVIVSGPFPGGVDPTSPVRKAVEEVHRRLKSTTFGHGVRVLNLSCHFVDPAGRPLDTLAKDGIHITAAGQRKWMEAVEPFLVNPSVTRSADRLVLSLGGGVTLDLDPEVAGPKALSLGAASVHAREPGAKGWLLDTTPIAMKVAAHTTENAAVRLELGLDLDSWEADASHREVAVPTLENPTETWRLAVLGQARGYDRCLTTRNRRGELNSLSEYTSVITRSPEPPLALEVTSSPVAGVYGHSTVSDPGLTYDIRRIRTEAGLEGWWFRSGYHLMNQVMNGGLNPLLREVVLLEPAGSDPVPYVDVVDAYVRVPQDRATLRL